MTAALHIVPVDRPLQVPTPAPNPEVLTVTAHPIAPGVVVITVRGGVDLFTSPLLLDSLIVHLHGPGSRLIVDLTGVGFFGAAGLSVLATARQATLAVGVGLCLVAHTRPVLLPLTITGMHTQFDIYPDLAHALRRVAGGPGRLTP